jgi:hypothetical protein
MLISVKFCLSSSLKQLQTLRSEVLVPFEASWPISISIRLEFLLFWGILKVLGGF